jgi:DNA-binding MarR family transcriptional regulator
MAITVGATSKAVDRLEAAGRVRRTANPDDRRSSLLALTAAGQQVLEAATPTFESELTTWIGSVLPTESLDQLAVILSMLRQRAELDTRTARAEPDTRTARADRH